MMSGPQLTEFSGAAHAHLDTILAPIYVHMNKNLVINKIFSICAYLERVLNRLHEIIQRKIWFRKNVVHAIT